MRAKAGFQLMPCLAESQSKFTSVHIICNQLTGPLGDAPYCWVPWALLEG